MKERLSALREWILKNGYFGFVLPATDEYRSGYVLPENNRLLYLTGYTGDAGELFVLLDRAFLFVDGRYTLQAQRETDADLITVMQTVDGKIPEWLLSAIPSGVKIGYDAWLHTPNDVKRMLKACAKNEALLVPVQNNPVDILNPSLLTKKNDFAFAHDIRYAGKDSTAKIADIVSELNLAKDDALVLSALDSIAWLLNVRGRDIPYTPVVQSHLILYKSGSVDWFVNPAKITDRLRSELSSLVDIKSPDTLPFALDALGKEKARVQISMDLSSAWIYERLSKNGAIVHAQEDPCQLPKACKNKEERENAVLAHIRDGAALCRFLAWFEKSAPSGVLTELRASEQLKVFRSENPLYRGESFPTIAATGKNGAVVHYATNQKNNAVIMKNSLFLIDSGAQYLDATTDVTRTVAVGTPNELMIRRYTQVLKGHIAVATIAFPEGTTGAQLDVLARQYLWRDGVDYFHGTGHGIGSFLGVHEGPQRISRYDNQVALQSGKIVSNEPGYYKADEFGIRIENAVMVEPLPQTETAEIKTFGFSTLTLAPFDRTLIDKAQLTPREKAWIDGYHARVRRIISPLVDNDTGAWLSRVCAPL